jgi:hypothetical protein
MLVRIGVINPSESEKVTMDVPNDAVVRNLTDAIVDTMGLPLRGENGRRLRYHLSTRDSEGHLERLDENTTLDENQVDNGDVLQVTVEMTAGNLPAQTLKQGYD